MRQLLTSLCATGVLALAAGCTTPVVNELENTEPAQRDAFNVQLTEEYKLLARFEADEMQDYLDADHFADKGLKAVRNQPTLPDPVWSRDLPKDERPALVDAYERLMDAYAHDAKNRYPLEAAVAQAKYDCWLEQQEENYQPEHIAACRKAFRTALNAIYAKEQAYIDGQKQTLVVVRAADRAPITRKAVVYFDFDEATIPAREKFKLDSVADSVKGMSGSYTLIAIGHADRAGGYDYNEELSVRRAEAVREALIDRGIEPSVVVVDGKGEMAPAEPTGDGVRKQGNRRVQIGIRKPPA